MDTQPPPSSKSTPGFLIPGLIFCALIFFGITVLGRMKKPTPPPPPAAGQGYPRQSELSRRPPELESLPKMSKIPDFKLTDQNDKPFDQDQLLGQLWIADFIFTRCPGPCAAMTRTMVGIQEKLGEAKNIHLISFSVDPEFDTPKVLDAYARSFKADPKRWSFLTGDRETLYELAVKGFKLSAMKDKEGIITHSSRIALVDGNGHIRAYYDGEKENSIQQLLKDVVRLQKESPQ